MKLQYAVTFIMALLSPYEIIEIACFQYTYATTKNDFFIRLKAWTNLIKDMY